MDYQQPRNKIIIYYKEVIFMININEIFPGEIFLPITNNTIPNIRPDTYYISNYGRVFNIKQQIVRKQQIGNSGYYTFTVALLDGSQKRVSTHRIELLVFKPILNPYRYEVNHIDGNKLNNHISNLEWVDKSGNMKHAYRLDLIGKGEDHCNSVYKTEQIEKICECLENGMKYFDIADIVGLPNNHATHSLISGVKHKVSWITISCKYNLQGKRSNRLLDDEQIINIYKLMKDKKSYDEIIQIMNLNPNINYYNVFNTIKWKKRFTNLTDLVDNNLI